MQCIRILNYHMVLPSINTYNFMNQLKNKFLKYHQIPWSLLVRGTGRGRLSVHFQS